MWGGGGYEEDEPGEWKSKYQTVIKMIIVTFCRSILDSAKEMIILVAEKGKNWMISQKVWESR